MNRILIGLAVALVIMLIVGGIGWKAKWLEVKLNNARVEKQVESVEGDLSRELNEDLDEYIQKSSRRRDWVDQAIDRIHEEAAPRPGGDDGDLARMRRADAAWRRGIVELCPDCAPGGVGDSDHGGVEELPGN